MSTEDIHFEMEDERTDMAVALLDDQSGRMERLREKIATAPAALHNEICTKMSTETISPSLDASFDEIRAVVKHNEVVIAECERLFNEEE